MLGGLSRLLNLRVADLFKSGGSFVSLDIGSSAVKFLETDGGAERLRVRNFGSAPLSSTAVQNNMVQDVTEVASVIRTLLDQSGVSATQAITVVPGPAVIIKKMQLPDQAAADLESAVLFEAGNVIPESLENVNLDYQVTGILEQEGQIEAILVAVKREIINSYTSALSLAGLEPLVVDVDYFALENMFELVHQPNPEEVIALVNIGARYSSINILRGGRSTFTGDVPVGGKEFNEALIRGLGVTNERAEQIKLGRDPEHSLEAVDALLGPARDFLSEEIHRALSFFWTAATDEAITGVVASGGGAQIPGFLQMLAERLEVPVQMAQPFEGADLSSWLDQSALMSSASSYAIAAGLAVRRPGDNR